jgi:serine/threonine protein kinase
MKILKKSMYQEERTRRLLYREICTLQALENEKHITELYEVLDSGDRIWVVMEYAAGGELFDFVHAKAPLPESQAREIYRPIVKVVAHMHEKKLVHRDLKLENVLLTETGKIRVADFGFSREFDPKDGLVSSLCGTPHYSPPEIIQGIAHDPRYADSWSLGVILYLLLFGQFPFSGTSIPETLQLIMKAEFTFSFPISDPATDLVSRLLTHTPTVRPTPDEIKAHPWFNKSRVHRPQKHHDDPQRIHHVVLQKMGIKSDVGIDEIRNLPQDDIVAYKIYRRRYQIHELQLPVQVSHSVQLPVLNPLPSGQPLQSNRDPVPGKSSAVMGMSTRRVQQRLPGMEKCIRINKIPLKARPVTSESRRPRLMQSMRAPDAKMARFRSTQLMRLRSLRPDGGLSELPEFNCDHTTLDSPTVLWNKLLTFLEKEPSISVLKEQDFELYLLITEPQELHVSLRLGCVHLGFGLIGYSLANIRGDEELFRTFDRTLATYLGLFP